MSTDWLDSDEELLLALREAMHAPDPTPPSVREAARAAFTWRTIDAELAELTGDPGTLSADPDPAHAGTGELVGMRASEEADLRTLSFEAPGLTIELGVSASALLGQLFPPGPPSLTLRVGDGSTTEIPVDEDGCFRIAPPPTGLFTLSCHTPDGRTIVTSLTRLP